MKFLKKIAATPLAKNIGHIIDSFNTPDDKHLNAPSLNAVKSEMAKVRTATITVTKADINFTLRFKRNMNVVTLTVEMFIPSTVRSAANWLTNNDFTMPDWAKTSDGSSTNLDNTIVCGGYSYNVGGVAMSSVMRVALSRASNTDYRIMFLYAQGENTSYPDGQTLIANLKYIVVD